MKNALLLTAVLFATAAAPRGVVAADVIDIGSRRELLVDDYLVEGFEGDAGLKLQRPTPQEVVITTDKPWEGNTCAYYTIFQDGDLYRMYYRGSHYDTEKRKSAHPEVVCYAQSKDGVHWTKPNLRLFEFNGSKENNIVWNGIGVHCFVAFKDQNPNCEPDARYKGIARGRPTGKKGLYVFKSPDAIHWSRMHPEPVITEGAFDSQNLAFWDPHAKLYREYHRTFTNRVRAIMTGVSSDFIHWSKPKLLQYNDTQNLHLYTNAVQSYPRAPHILLAFPTRYLPQEGSRVEPIFMSSRDGQNFHRWLEAVVPEDAPKDRSGNRSNYMTWGMLKLPGAERELSVYATEAYYTGPDSRVRRFTYRVDGFVSAHASPAGGALTTKPIRFKGERLSVNFATADGGSLRVAVLDTGGKPVPGFTLEDCQPLQGDAIDQTVSWGGNTDVGGLSGKPIRMRVELKAADLYSFTFGK